MMFDPVQVVENGVLIAIIVATIIISKLVGVFSGNLIVGNSLKHSIQSSLFMTQIGEFSFVLGAVAIKLDILPQSYLAVFISTSIITTILTPFLIKHMDFISQNIESKTPNSLKSFFENYQQMIVLYQSQIGLFFKDFSSFKNLVVIIKERARHIGSIRNRLTPWDATIFDFVISPDSLLSGQTLESAKIRERYNVSIAMIDRGNRRILAFQKTERLFPGDILYVVGQENHIKSFEQVVEANSSTHIQNSIEDVFLMPYEISKTSRLLNKEIRNSGIREIMNGMIVGLERNGVRILNPDANICIQENDLLWIVSDNHRKLKEFI